MSVAELPAHDTAAASRWLSIVGIGEDGVEGLAPIHEAQLLTYLKLTGIKIGFLMNFNVVVLKNGIRRLVH